MRFRVVALIALVAAAVLPVAAQMPGGGVTVQPVAEKASVAAGETLRLALDVKVPAGLHLQADRPRDKTVIPARLALKTPAGLTFVDVTFPPSTTFRLIGFDEPLDVFEGDFAVGASVAIDKTHGPGSVTLPGTFRYQACDDTTCFNPVTVETSWTFDVLPSGRPASAPEQAELFRRIDFTRAYPPAAAARAGRHGEATRAIEDVLALFDRFTILDTQGYSSPAEFIEFISNAEAGVKEPGLLEGRGPIAVLAIVFLGGLALNLTPCVLPMIPINLAIIGAGAKSGRRGRGFLLGSAYGSAMAVVYGVLGLVVILTAGTFGTINASAWFNFGIAALFVFLGLAMFDVVSLDFSRFSSRIRFNEASRGTVFLAFAMGAVAALLAGACVAPVVVQVVVFASDLYARGDSAALALPFVLGLGMALPVAPRRRRARVAAEAGAVDGPRQAGHGRVHPGHRGVLRMDRLRHHLRAVGGPARRESRRRGTAQGRLARIARRRPAGGRTRQHARARRFLGKLVQELPGDGSDDAEGPGRPDEAHELHEDQVPGRGSRRVARA